MLHFFPPHFHSCACMLLVYLFSTFVSLATVAHSGRKVRITFFFLLKAMFQISYTNTSIRITYTHTAYMKNWKNPLFGQIDRCVSLTRRWQSIACDCLLSLSLRITTSTLFIFETWRTQTGFRCNQTELVCARAWIVRYIWCGGWVFSFSHTQKDAVSIPNPLFCVFSFSSI